MVARGDPGDDGIELLPRPVERAGADRQQPFLPQPGEQFRRCATAITRAMPALEASGKPYLSNTAVSMETPKTVPSAIFALISISVIAGIRKPAWTIIK